MINSFSPETRGAISELYNKAKPTRTEVRKVLKKILKEHNSEIKCYRKDLKIVEKARNVLGEI